MPYNKIALIGVVFVILFLSGCFGNDEQGFSLEIDLDEVYAIEGFLNWQLQEIVDKNEIQAVVEHLNSYSLTDRGNINFPNESPDIWMRFLDVDGNTMLHLAIYGGGLIRILDPSFEGGFRQLGMYRIINGQNAVWEFWEKFDNSF